MTQQLVISGKFNSDYVYFGDKGTIIIIRYLDSHRYQLYLKNHWPVIL